MMHRQKNIKLRPDSINWLVCVVETECVLCEVQNEFPFLT